MANLTSTTSTTPPVSRCRWKDCPCTACSRLELHLRCGDRLAITGANGSGKTTLLRVLRDNNSPMQAPSGLEPTWKLPSLSSSLNSSWPSTNLLSRYAAQALCRVRCLVA